MINFINSIIDSIEQKNWYGALFVSLAMPDICGKIEFPDTHSSDRYPNWFKKYLSPYFKNEFKLEIVNEYEIIITQTSDFEYLLGKELYGLRCDCLHEGKNCVKDRKGNYQREDIEKVIFTTKEVLEIYNSDKKTVTFNIEVFCNNVIRAVCDWLDEIKDDPIKAKKLNSLIEIH